MGSVLRALTLLLLLAGAALAGSKTSQGCNLCRKEREPPSKKLPDYANSCADFYPSAECPVVDTSEPQGAMDEVPGPQSNCHVNPYQAQCPKKERKKGSTKYASNKNQSGEASQHWLGGAVVLIVLVTGLGLVVYFFVNQRTNRLSPPIVSYNIDIEQQKNAWGDPVSRPVNAGSYKDLSWQVA